MFARIKGEQDRQREGADRNGWKWMGTLISKSLVPMVYGIVTQGGDALSTAHSRGVARAKSAHFMIARFCNIVLLEDAGGCQ